MPPTVPSPAETEDPIFLGFGAFETTAFISAILVALYSFIPNPQGRQRASDKSEYAVYTGWRNATILIAVQLAVMLAVFITQVTTSVPPRTIVWLLLLMLAPWAPLAGDVGHTVAARRRVRAMMRARLSRNELAAVLRDRFKFGQRALAVPLVVRHRHPHCPFPPHPAATLAAHPVLRNHIPALRAQASAAMETGEPSALDLGTLWTVNQGPQPRPHGSYYLHLPSVVRDVTRRVVSFFSLALLWTTRGDTQLLCLPYPEYDPPLDSSDRSAVLDDIDELQQGGTLDDAQMAKMQSRFCADCCMAVRGAVEAFMESSYKSHSDMRAHVYLRHAGINWRGNFEQVINEMWEAVFMGEARGDRVYSLDDDFSPDYGDRSKVTTTKMQGLLFIIARSLLGRFSQEAHRTMQRVGEFVRDGLNSEQWWANYWDSVARLMNVSEDDLPADKVVVDETVQASFKRALRDSVDDDMKHIIDLLIDEPIDGSLCVDESCKLRHRTVFKPTRFTKKQ